MPTGASTGGCRGQGGRGAGRPCRRFCPPPPNPDGLPQLSRSGRRRRARRHRHLHAAQSARLDDRRCDAGGQARHLRKAVCGLFRARRRQGADRQARAEGADVRARAGGNGEDPRGDREDRKTLHVCRGLDLRAGGDQDRGDPESHQGQDPVHEGRREPLRFACRARRAMGDDRRRLADPDGMPSAVGGALSQAGRGQARAARRSALPA